MEKQAVPETMLKATRQFADPQVAHDFFVQYRWPNGVACPRHGCGSAAVTYLSKYRRWNCRECLRQFTAKVGTIFEDSPIGLDKWLPAFWLISSNRNGISSHELGRALKVTQKTAWFMLHRIREAMADETTDKLSGYTHANPRHLDRYLEEQAVRFDERKNDYGPRFVKATKGADSKRLTHKRLIAKA